MSKAQRKGKGNSVVIAPPQIFNDLFLNFDPDTNTLTTSVSPNAEFSGIQKFVDPATIDGARSIANWNYWFNTTDGEESAFAQGTGHYRSWSQDFNNDVHLSNWIAL